MATVFISSTSEDLQPYRAAARDAAIGAGLLPNMKRANFGMKVGHPTPVGLYPACNTPESVADMAGNLWEWVEDWYDEKREARMLRGGSWLSLIHI